MTVYVFSTLTASNTYTLAGSNEANDLPTTERAVTIKGGSNLPSKHMLTSIGYMTEVSDEDWSWLQENPVFKLHRDNGFITIRDKPAAAEKVATDMETRDQSAPLVDADFKDGEKPVGARDEDDDRPRNKNNRKA